MEIIFLTALNDNPIWYAETQNVSIEPISEQEITNLEQTYNNGNPFPRVLKELLFLAGSKCYFLDYGLNDTQQELQEFLRENMEEQELSISRPFYAVDIYNAGDQFLFVYLDEGDNPIVHQGSYYDEPSENQWIISLGISLQRLIEVGIERVKAGRNPF